jgi:hypothetical protein
MMRRLAVAWGAVVWLSAASGTVSLPEALSAALVFTLVAYPAVFGAECLAAFGRLVERRGGRVALALPGRWRVVVSERDG